MSFSAPYVALGSIVPYTVQTEFRTKQTVEPANSSIEDAMESVLRRNSGVGTDRTNELLSQLLEAVLGIELDGEMLSKAMHSYDRKVAVMHGV